MFLGIFIEAVVFLSIFIEAVVFLGIFIEAVVFLGVFIESERRKARVSGKHRACKHRMLLGSAYA